MNAFNANTQNIRSKQRYFSMLSCMVFVLLISYTSCQQAKEDDAAALNDSDYTDADDIEWGNFPIADPTTKGHPVIFYKEDIVSEDYDPNKDNKSTSSSKETKPQFRRRYKDINRRNRLNRTENYRYIKPDKVYFDVYPIEYDKVNEDDSKFNDDDIKVDVISLLDDPNNNDQEDGAYSKHQLNKRPKKVVRHHRQRRDVAKQEQQVNRQQKRAAHFYYGNSVPVWFASKRKLKIPIQGIYINVPKPGTIVRQTTRGPAVPTPTPMPDIKNRFDDDFDDSWKVWGSQPVTEMQPRRRRPPPPIIHPGDEDYASNNGQAAPTTTTTPFPPRTTTYRPRTTYRPTVRTTEAPVLPPSQGSSLKQLETLEPAPLGIMPCVWAVSSCCRSNSQIHYSCFEYLGCIGDFWDVNPCNPKFVQDALDTVNNFFKSK